MRSSTISLTGTGLRFDRDGRHLIIVEPDAIAVVALAGGTTRLPITDARAAVGFDEQIWIATGDDRLVRMNRGGAPIGEPVALPFAASPSLHAAPCGPAAAVWSQRVAIADGVVELPEADAVIPITGKRFVIARGARLALPSGMVIQLPANATVLDGAVTLCGKLAVLLVAHAGGRHLMVVALGSGQILQRCATPSSIVRLATRRAIALVQLEPRLVWAVDLLAGRELGSIHVPYDLADFAIDPDGKTVALRGPAGDIELAKLDELLRAPPASSDQASENNEVGEDLFRASRAERANDGPSERDALEQTEREVVEQAPRAQRETHPSPTSPTSPTSLLVCGCCAHDALVPSTSAHPPLAALVPRVTVSIDRDEARRQLAQELRSVSVWTFAAIAEAWDTRRLGYGNESSKPFELEVAALLGVSAGFADTHVAAARELNAEHAATIANDPRARTIDTPLGELIAEHGLTQRAADILVVIAAAALRGETARLYGILANDVGRPTVDEQLVHQVLGVRHDREDLATDLDPRAPLVRLGIVRVAGKRARPFAELSIDPAILDRLRGVAPELGAATAIRGDARDLAELDLPRATLDAACTALAAPRDAVRIVVRGRIGSGRRTLLAALARVAGRELAVIDAQALARDANAFAGELATALRRAHLAGHVPCVVHLADVAFGEHAAHEIASEPLRVHPGVVAIVASPDETVPFPPGHVAIELPVLAETERCAVWQRALADAGVTADLATLAARYRIGPGVIRRAISAARGAADSTVAIEAYIRQTRDARLGQYARRVTRLASWESVVFPPDILDSLRELIARVRHGRTVFETWGMSTVMATSRGLTALFQGPPGTGKTLVAGVIARELGLDLYQVDLSKVMSKWIGETERNLSQIFDAAEDGQVVLLFDEADSLFAKRTEVRSSNDRYANLEVNYLLQRLDSFEGIAILTTNSGTSIDQAFKRRLSFRLSFPFPDEETREQLWRAHLPSELPIHGTLSLAPLARKYHLSGGYIRNACLRAAFLAAQDDTAVHQRHLERAVALELAELGKLSGSGAIE